MSLQWRWGSSSWSGPPPLSEEVTPPARDVPLSTCQVVVTEEGVLIGVIRDLMVIQAPALLALTRPCGRGRTRWPARAMRGSRDSMFLFPPAVGFLIFYIIPLGLCSSA